MNVHHSAMYKPLFYCRTLSRIKYSAVLNNGMLLADTFRNMSTVHNPIEQAIREKLYEQLQTTHLEVINESYMHNVPKNAETHFKVVVVSNQFQDLTLIKRHRIVNDLLKEEFNKGVHALSIVAKTPEQWQESDQTIKPSPTCRGGFGK